MGKGRFEAFSDGVLAIIITIMVLELHVPHGDDLAALTAQWPIFVSYVLSFIYVGIYWNNHHHLLHAARRIYKKRLKHCDLQTLEREVLGHTRQGDVDGALVPVLFFEYLRSGDFGPMELVMEHNRQDVASLVTLLCRLCHAVALPQELTHAEDIHACGRLMERTGNLLEAERCYRLAAERSVEPLRELSMLLKRTGRSAEAAPLWRRMAEDGGFGLLPHEELAKYYEHHCNDPERALEAVQAARGLIYAGGRAAQALERREARLMTKLEKGVR